MSQTISINNFGSNNVLEQSRLNADALIGATILTLENNQGFVNNSFLIAGVLGNETSEMTKVTATPSGGTDITVTATVIKHLRYDPITRIFGDQIKLYRAANVNGLAPTDGSFAQVGSNISIDPDQSSTSATDATGGSGYWYKFTYYNSVSLTETNLADATAVRGGGYGDYASLEEIRTQSGFKNSRYITDQMVDQKRQAAQATINSALVGLYSVPFTAPINQLINDITIRLAAGWLLTEQHNRSSLNAANGRDMISSVMNKDKTGDLDKLQAGTMKLLDSAGTDMTLATSTGGFKGFPDNNTAGLTTADGGGDFLFEIGGVRGYQGRTY